MTVTTVLKLLRPAQWMKNLMLLFPPFLGGEMLQEGALGKAIIPLLSFCLASSATYIFNDILDATHDSHHPRKRNRPIPAGDISWKKAGLVAILLFFITIFLAASLSSTFLFFLLAYLAVAVSYSLYLKAFPIVDIFCIAAGFLFRLQAGGEAFDIAISEWLFLSVFLLSLFLGTGKRLSEKYTLADAGKHRKSLLRYPEGFLEGTMYMCGATVLVTYTMYVIQQSVLVYTVPLCTFGLLRYMLLVKSHRYSDPTESLLKDGVLFVVSFLWAAMVGWGIYSR